MKPMGLVKYLISTNTDLINRTGISNCHCIGLSSFIINENPKIRLFIGEKNCELFSEYDYLNPIIPIHPHKYDDIFIQLEGKLINHLYEVGGDLEFKKWEYPRISGGEIKYIGNENLQYLGGRSDVTELKSKELHSVSLEGEKSSWLVLETFRDLNFKQISYHQNLIKKENLYKPIENSSQYLRDYFNF
jgi:hypothetical protein